MTRSTRQRGTAIIAALLVVMLAATIATYLLAQQSQALTRTARATARAQMALYAPATIDWARAVLFDVQKKGAIVHNKQDWAQNLIAQPLEGAVASGVIRDECAKFNLNNLLRDDGSKSEADWMLLRTLLQQQGLNPDLANAVLDWVDANDDTSNPGGAEDQTYLSLATPYRAANRRMVQAEELYLVRGFDAASVKRLLPFVTALPTRSSININTAPREVLTAVFPDLAGDDIAALIRFREEAQPFTGVDDIKHYALKTLPPAAVDQYLDVKSDYFLATLAITGEGGQVRQMALLQRKNGATPAAAKEWPGIIWVKDF